MHETIKLIIETILAVLFGGCVCCIATFYLLEKSSSNKSNDMEVDRLAWSIIAGVIGGIASGWFWAATA